jgi:hypothetical protein
MGAEAWIQYGIILVLAVVAVIILLKVVKKVFKVVFVLAIAIVAVALFLNVDPFGLTEQFPALLKLREMIPFVG